MAVQIDYTEEQLKEMETLYKEGVSLTKIGKLFGVDKGVIVRRLRQRGIIQTDEKKEKVCINCGRLLPIECFPKDARSKDGHRGRCKECTNALRRKVDVEKIATDIDSYKKYIVRAAKTRAKEKGIPFDITYEDFEIPEICPLLGIPIKHHIKEGKGGINFPDSPSLDKIIPEKGYVKGNVWIISKRANSIKNDASIEELKLLVSNFEKKLNGE